LVPAKPDKEIWEKIGEGGDHIGMGGKEEGYLLAQDLARKRLAKEDYSSVSSPRN
jgi:hypothetical protein